MGLAVELHLDEPGADAIRSLMNGCGSTLSKIGGAPHISLAVLDDTDRRSLAGEGYAARTSPGV